MCTHDMKSFATQIRCEMFEIGESTGLETECLHELYVKLKTCLRNPRKPQHLSSLCTRIKTREGS
jgi:hypothetical protein